ncbi:MAG: hypothetical protein ACOCXA_00430 [Planctomycetota bacterium]
MRALICLLLSLPLAHAAAHRFEAGERRIYIYEASQTVNQHTLDEVLEHRSDLYWEYGLHVMASDADGAELELTILRVRASHRGPAYRESIDSAESLEADTAPLLGHLLGLVQQQLRLRWSNDEGITHVQSDGLPARLAPPGDIRRDNAERFYGEEALTALWASILLRPGHAGGDWQTGNELPLTWTWDGTVYEIRSRTPTRIQLGAGATAFTASIDQLEGNGSVTIDDQGVLQEASGKTTWRMRFEALTQAVEQTHELRWQNLLWRYKGP